MFQTKIDVIDEIIAHFSKPEADYGLNGDYGQCVYRGPNNKRCAIGCLIPDEIYDPVWDLEILGRTGFANPGLIGTFWKSVAPIVAGENSRLRN